MHESLVQRAEGLPEKDGHTIAQSKQWNDSKSPVDSTTLVATNRENRRTYGAHMQVTGSLNRTTDQVHQKGERATGF